MAHSRTRPDARKPSSPFDNSAPMEVDYRPAMPLPLPLPLPRSDSAVPQGNAPADVPFVVLRHRLFPRAMAWNIHHAAQHHGGAYEAQDDAPMADAPAYDQQPQQQPQQSQSPQTPSPTPAGGFARPSPDARERLFQTIGKWLDDTAAPGVAGSASSTPRPAYPSAAPSSSKYDMIRLTSAAPSSSAPSSAPSSSSSSSFVSASTVAAVSRTMNELAHPSSKPTSHVPTTAATTVRKRQRNGAAPGTSVPARPGMSTSTAKRCSVHDCGKIAVSKGLCRGHGGGRRCTYPGCTKCAQSRSPFCWAHGGGKRCEAPNCRRSRKTKRFCVDHVEMEHTVPLASDSDESHGGSHTAPSDTESVTSVSSSSHSLHLQQFSPGSDQAQPGIRPTPVPVPSSQAPRAAPLRPAPMAHPLLQAHHLPSLTEALKRVIPTLAAQHSQQVSLPQTRDRLWPTTNQPSPIAALQPTTPSFGFPKPM